MPILRRAKVVLQPVDLHHALNLRPDVQIMAFGAQVDPPSLQVVLFSPGFDSCTEGEESPVVPLHSVQKVVPVAQLAAPAPAVKINKPWKHTSGGPGQQPWLCPKGHVLAEHGSYNYHNVEWYRVGVKPPFGCKQCKRETVVAAPKEQLSFAFYPPEQPAETSERQWQTLRTRHTAEWQSKRPNNSSDRLDWIHAHRIRFQYFVHRTDPQTIADTYGLTRQSVTRILRFKAWHCTCAPCQRWAIDALMRLG